MSPDVIGVIIAAATLVGGLFGGIGLMLSRQTVKLESRFGERFDGIDARLDRMDGDIRGLRDDVTELKVAVARLEGPAPRLVLPR